MHTALRRMRFVVAACVLPPLPSAAGFEMDVDGTLLLGNLVPSFYGGVAFQECSGERWLIAGANLFWSGETCDSADDATATVTGSAGWGNPVVASLPPKPSPCALCSEGDLVDLFVPVPKPTGCPLCVPGIDALYTYSLGLPEMGAYAKTLDSRAVLISGPLEDPFVLPLDAQGSNEWWHNWLRQTDPDYPSIQPFQYWEFRPFDSFNVGPALR